MSVTLQVALFIASGLFVLLAASLIPVALLALRQLGRMTLSVDLLKGDLQLLLHESRELVRNVNDLSKQASRQIEDMGKVAHTAEQWTERLDRLVNEVGAVIEPPVYSAARNMNLIRAGVSVFMRVLAHGNNNIIKEKERNHV